MKELWEGNLKVVFEDDWQCVKWDDCASYREGICKLPQSAAVDFLGIHHGCLYFIEVKNYREHRIKNRGKHEDLPQFIAEKVRDTIAGVIGASVMRKMDDFSRECANLIGRTREEQRIRVVAWIIEDKDLPDKDRVRAGIRRKNLVRKLRWLTTNVSDTNPLVDPKVPDVHVSLERETN